MGNYGDFTTSGLQLSWLAQEFWELKSTDCEASIVVHPCTKVCTIFLRLLVCRHFKKSFMYSRWLDWNCERVDKDNPVVATLSGHLHSPPICFPPPLPHKPDFLCFYIALSSYFSFHFFCLSVAVGKWRMVLHHATNCFA